MPDAVALRYSHSQLWLHNLTTYPLSNSLHAHHLFLTVTVRYKHMLHLPLSAVGNSPAHTDQDFWWRNEEND